MCTAGWLVYALQTAAWTLGMHSAFAGLGMIKSCLQVSLWSLDTYCMDQLAHFLLSDLHRALFAWQGRYVPTIASRKNGHCFAGNSAKSVIAA